MTVSGRWMRGGATLAVAVALGGTSHPHARAAIDPAQRCAAGRFEAAGKYAYCRLKVRATAAKKGIAADYTKCDAALDAKWQKIDGAGCPFSGDATTVETDSEAFEDRLIDPVCGPIPGLTDCTTDTDCIVVNGIDCCTCTMGGQQAAVNKVKAELVLARRRACCVEGRLPHICLAVGRCQSNLSAVCQGGTCSLVGLATTTTTTPACVTTTTTTTTTEPTTTTTTQPPTECFGVSFGVSIDCTSQGQLCEPPFTISIDASDTLKARFGSGPRACSPFRLCASVDETEIGCTEFDGTPNQNLDLFEIPVSSGTHVLSLQAEGRVGGCNSGDVRSWGGTLCVR